MLEAIPSQPNHEWLNTLAGTLAYNLTGVSDILLIPMNVQANSKHEANLYGLSQSDGSVLWRYQLSANRVNGIVSANNLPGYSDVFIFASASTTNLLEGQSRIVALDKKGRVHWTWEPEGVHQISAPGLSAKHNRLCATIDSNTLVWLEATTGKPLRSVSLPFRASLSAPAVDHDTAYVPCRSPHLLAVTQDGRFRWQYTYGSDGTWLSQAPLVGEGQLYISSTDGVLLALNVADGTLVWQQRLRSNLQSLSPVSSDGERVYAGALDGVYALNIAHGHLTWHFPTSRPVTAPPIASEGIVYVAGHDHTFYALEARSGRELWQYKTYIEQRIEVAPYLITKSEYTYAFVGARGGVIQCLAWMAGEAPQKITPTPPKTGNQVLQSADRALSEEDLARAAELYEEAGAWEIAVDLWQQLDRPLRQAQMWQALAQQLTDDPDYDEVEKAKAWERASQAYHEIGEREKSAICARQVAKHRRLPIIVLDALNEGLVLNEWSYIQFIIHNEGFGTAHDIVIHVSGELFDGQVTSTQQLTALPAQGKHTEPVDVKPLESGTAVPLRLELVYKDRNGEPYQAWDTIYFPVAREPAMRQAVQTADVLIASFSHPHEDARKFLGQLRQNLKEYFSLEELIDLCFDLDIPYEELKGHRDQLNVFTRELIAHVKRQDKLTVLRQYCQEKRPGVNW